MQWATLEPPNVALYQTTRCPDWKRKGTQTIMSLLQSPRFWAATAVFVGVLALLPSSFHSERYLETATRVEGSDAEIVVQELKTRFNSSFVDKVVLVVEGIPAANTPDGTQALSDIVNDLKDQPGISGLVSYLDLHDTIFLGKGGGTFVVLGLSSPNGVESLVPGLKAYART